MSQIKQEALLKDWRFETVKSARSLIVVGHVYGHPRFAEGQLIHSSLIVQLKMRDENNGFAETLHTYYRLEGGNHNG